MKIEKAFNLLSKHGLHCFLLTPHTPKRECDLGESLKSIKIRDLKKIAQFRTFTKCSLLIICKSVINVSIWK